MRTVFVRLIEAEDKGQALSSALESWKSDGQAEGVYEADARSFGKVPGSPFAYWVGEAVRDLFEALPPLASEGRQVKQGLATADDFRFLRLWWEVEPGKKGRGQKWVPFAKGGEYSPYYADIHLVVNWEEDGGEIRNFYNPRTGRLASRPQNTDFYFRPGLTWPLRTTSGLSMRPLPQGGAFGHKGPAILAEGDDGQTLLALLAIMNSTGFQGLVAILLAADDAAARSYEIGVLSKTPVPRIQRQEVEKLAPLAREAWSQQRMVDTASQVSHAFVLPGALRSSGPTIGEGLHDWMVELTQVADRLDQAQRQVDVVIESGYNLTSGAERPRETTLSGDSAAVSDDEDDEAPEELLGLTGQAGGLLEWTVGVAFGRFDIRLATGERPIPEDPDPFDPLPACSPGMLQNDEGLPATTSPPGYPIEVAWDGILVDDEGHPRDIVRHIRRVLSEVSDGQDWAAEAEEILSRDLRSWVQRSLFEDHIKRYSKSRRKAPIFWRLGTPSGSYSVWLYYPRATGDTLYRVLNDYVEPKLRHEESALLRLRQEAGASPTASQQKRIEAQETRVSEVQDMRGELEVLAGLWKPEFDDGVVLNFAPFWRLVAHTRGWQKECQKHWKKLREGEYDWSYTAMRLWPERVVPACAEDRSFAIAHGLEEEFFPEDGEGDDGDASKVRESERIQKLVDARSSAAVKQALQTLLQP